MIEPGARVRYKTYRKIFPDAVFLGVVTEHSGKILIREDDHWRSRVVALDKLRPHPHQRPCRVTLRVTASNDPLMPVALTMRVLANWSTIQTFENDVQARAVAHCLVEAMRQLGVQVTVRDRPRDWDTSSVLRTLRSEPS